MIFDKNQKEFPSEAHKAIWDAGVHILPLETTLPKEVREKLPPYMTDSCEQLRRFFLSILRDLYENPEVYEPYQYRRLGVQYKFITPFADFGLVGEPDENCLIINRLVFDKLIKKQVNSKTLYKNGTAAINVEERIKILQRTGTIISYEGGNAVITNTLYPNMFYAMREMALVTVKEKGSGDNSFTYCDFRKLCKSYKYDKYESSLIFLNDEQRNIAENLDSIAKKHKMSRSVKSGHCDGYNVNYEYKKKQIMAVNCMASTIILKIFPPYDKKDPDSTNGVFYKSVENDSYELKKYFLRYLKRCRLCIPVAENPSCAKCVRIFGLSQRLCHTVQIIIHIQPHDFSMTEKILNYIMES